MDEPRFDRRRALQAGGALGLLGLAGCLDVFEDRDLPDFEQYLFPTEDEEVFYMYAALGTLADLEDDFFDPGAEPDDDDDDSSTGGDDSNGDDPDTQDDPEDQDDTEDQEEADGDDGSDQDDGDPLLTTPLGSYVSLAIAATFTLDVAGLSWLIEEPADDDHESAVEDLLFVNDTVLVSGSLDTAELDEELRTVPEDAFFQMEYEQVDTLRGHDLYAPVGQEGANGDDGAGDSEGTGDGNGQGEADEESVVALDDTRLVVGTRANVERCLEASAGDGQRVADEYDPAEWLLSRAASPHIAVGAYKPGGYGSDVGEPSNESEGETIPDDTGETENGTDDALTDLDDPAGITGSLTFVEGESVAEAAFAAVMSAPLSDDERARVESAFGTAATEVSVDLGDERLEITGTYNEEALAAGMETAEDEAL